MLFDNDIFFFSHIVESKNWEINLKPTNAKRSKVEKRRGSRNAFKLAAAVAATAVAVAVAEVDVV